MIQKMLRLSENKLREYSSGIILSSAIIAAISWYTISSFSYNDYVRICNANPQLDRCMDPYWNQYRIDKPLLNISITFFSISTVLWLILKFRGK